MTKRKQRWEISYIMFAMGKLLKYKHLFAGMAVISVFLAAAPPARAFLPGPFGGPIVGLRPGSNCIHITVGPPRPGDFVYIPGLSILFSFFSIRPGAQVLGLAGPDVFCKFGSKAGFAGPLIWIMGTSF